MTRRAHQSPAVLLLAAAVLLLWPGDVPSQPEKKAAPTAVSIAKEWRYPGVGTVATSLSPLKSQAFYIERYAVKADFAEVWNHFAAKTGSEARYKDKMIWALMGELKAPAKGHFMVFDVIGQHGQEAHFGQNSEKKTIHVEIRRSGEKQTGVCMVVGVR